MNCTKATDVLPGVTGNGQKKQNGNKHQSRKKLKKQNHMVKNMSILEFV
jgi:hypothetical protein